MHFEIRALREPGGVVSLALEAADRGDAERQARALGYLVLAVRVRRSLGDWLGVRRARFPLALFSQELIALLDAGLTLVESIETLAEKEHRDNIRKVLEALTQRLREGQTLSTALRQHPTLFPELYVATVSAAERTGDLSEALGRFVNYQSQMDLARRKLVSASIYPVTLLFVGGLVTIFLLTYVVPRFSRIYADVGRDLPLASRLLLEWGLMLERHGLALFFVLAGFAVAAVWAVTRPAVRLFAITLLMRVTAVRERLHVYQLARFYRTLGMLLRGGTPIVTALGMVEGLLAAAWRERLALAHVDVRSGHAISSAMESRGLTTPVALRMLRVGERTGKMGEMMERVAAFYDDEIARWMDWFTRLIEPLLMAVIGIVIGTIVVLMYFPIFELAGSLQ
jgi:general secretion pathway protein F